MSYNGNKYNNSTVNTQHSQQGRPTPRPALRSHILPRHTPESVPLVGPVPYITHHTGSGSVAKIPVPVPVPVPVVGSKAAQAGLESHLRETFELNPSTSDWNFNVGC